MWWGGPAEEEEEDTGTDEVRTGELEWLLTLLL